VVNSIGLFVCIATQLQLIIALLTESAKLHKATCIQQNIEGTEQFSANNLLDNNLLDNNNNDNRHFLLLWLRAVDGGPKEDSVVTWLEHYINP